MERAARALVGSDGSESQAARVPAGGSMRRQHGVDTWDLKTLGPLVPGTYRLDLRGHGQVLALDVKTF